MRTHGAHTRATAEGSRDSHDLRAHPGTRAREVALRDRRLEAPEVRPILRTRRPGAVADAASAQGSGVAARRPSRAHATAAEGARDQARAPAAARAVAARVDRARERLRLPGLRWRAAPRGRGRRRDARVDPGALQGHPSRAPEVRLFEVRE